MFSGETPTVKCHPQTHIPSEEARQVLMGKATPTPAPEKGNCDRGLRSGSPPSPRWLPIYNTGSADCPASRPRRQEPPQTKARSPPCTPSKQMRWFLPSQRPRHLFLAWHLEEKPAWGALEPRPSHAALFTLRPGPSGGISFPLPRLLLANGAWHSNSRRSGSASDRLTGGGG